MTFCYLLFLSLLLFSFKHSTAHWLIRVIGFITGILLLLISGFYSYLMPVIDLPAPEGSYGVGSRSFVLEDQSRPEIHTIDSKDKRVLFIEAWYPIDHHSSKDAKQTSLWQELYKGENDVVSFFMKYLKRVQTHSYQEALPSSKGPFPVIVFNHGLQMFTSQNTLLMEHLASNGYVVFSLAHPYESLRVNLPNKGAVLPKFLSSKQAFMKGLEWMDKASRPIEAAKDSISLLTNPHDQQQVMLAAIENSELNQVVERWRRDNQLTINWLFESQNDLQDLGNVLDTSRIGVMGMSLGGATATEICKSDHRVKAAINIDGLQYGNRNNVRLSKPFMMIYSQDGEGLNQFLKSNTTNDYHQYTFVGSKHADFTDMTLVWPVMKVYGQLGSIPGERMIKLTNEVVLNFWDHYLKNASLKEFDALTFPELESQIELIAG